MIFLAVAAVLAPLLVAQICYIAYQLIFSPTHPTHTTSHTIPGLHDTLLLMEGPRLAKPSPCTIITHGIAPGHYLSTIAQQSLYIIACSLLSHFASGHHTFVCGGKIALLLVSCSCCIHNRQATLCCHYIHNFHTRPAVAFHCY